MHRLAIALALLLPAQVPSGSCPARALSASTRK